MDRNQVVDHEAWVEARKRLLEKEKEFTKLRDELSAERRRLPWERVQEEYLFETPEGSRTLAELFDGRSQLIVYHFMFDPEWSEGCKSCSLMADHYAPSVIHLQQRDVTLVTVSKAPLRTLEAFRKRMGWDFRWVSSAPSDFNRDFGVSFTDEELADSRAYYNYRVGSFSVREAPGMSVFYRNEDGEVFHTYSAYSRGLDIFLTVYHLLDIVPRGRDEEGLSYTMEWVRHHDRYPDGPTTDPHTKLVVPKK